MTAADPYVYDNSGLLLRFTDDDPYETFYRVRFKLSCVESFLLLATWSETLRTQQSVGYYRKDINAVRIARLSINSPFETVIAITGVAGSIIGTARGALYLYSKWQDIKIKRAKADYAVAAYDWLTEEFSRAKLETLGNLPINDFLENLPTDREINQSAQLLAQAEEVTLTELPRPHQAE